MGRTSVVREVEVLKTPFSYSGAYARKRGFCLPCSKRAESAIRKDAGVPIPPFELRHLPSRSKRDESCIGANHA